MVEIGKFNRLVIAKERSVGFFFDGGDDGDILMPKRHQPEHCAVGDEMNVFVFLDAEERLTATVMIPFAQVGEVAWLKVVDNHRVGAFLDWGLTKDLLVPVREQEQEMEAGQSYLVRILLDQNQRIIGSTRLDDYLKSTSDGAFKVGQQVSLLVADRIELGYRAVVNQSHWGVLYDNELFQEIAPGQKLTGFIKKIREDQKLDVSLKKPGYSKSGTESLASRILKQIKQQGGFLPLNDKSPPEEIHAAFQVSKKTFKQAVGKLYKERRISLEPEGIRLVR